MMVRGLNTNLRSARAWLFVPVFWAILPLVHAHEQNTIEHDTQLKSNAFAKQVVLHHPSMDSKLTQTVVPNDIWSQSLTNGLPPMTRQASNSMQWAAARTLTIDDVEASVPTAQEIPNSGHSKVDDMTDSPVVLKVTGDAVNETPSNETKAPSTQETLSETALNSNSEVKTNDSDSTGIENTSVEFAEYIEEQDIDPSERINRAVFLGNEVLDKGLIKPVAKTYKSWIPAGIRRCFSNIFENIGMPYTAVNNVLQGKIKSAGQDVGRVLINSTIGLGGCFDVASDLGIPKHDEDFGQTLGVWGVPTGRYIMLPFFGPSNVRDALTKPIDLLANPLGYITKIRLRNSLNAFKVVDTRTNLLELTDILDENSLDKYIMLRDSWIERRKAQVDDTDGSYDNNVMSRLEPKNAVESEAINAKPHEQRAKDEVQTEVTAHVLNSQDIEAAQMTPTKPRVVNINQQ